MSCVWFSLYRFHCDTCTEQQSAFLTLWNCTTGEVLPQIWNQTLYYFHSKVTERSDLISLLTFVVSSSLFQRSESDFIDLAHIDNDMKRGPVVLVWVWAQSVNLVYWSFTGHVLSPVCVCVCGQGWGSEPGDNGVLINNLQRIIFTQHPANVHLISVLTGVANLRLATQEV